jgi:multiple sugar transport system ATP-binding protein
MVKEAAMAEVKLQGVTKCYGSLKAVADMNWTANQGEFLVLFGPAGAGKTTTLKLIAGLETPDEGDIYFDGQPIGEVDTPDRNVAMAFENYALYPHMSVFENIAFPMLVPGRRERSKEEIKRRVTEIATVLQIETLLERTPRELSGGQRQRVALGRCLVREPRVFLFDEPIAHLDAKLRHRMYAELKRIQRERGTTTVYATPAQTEAMAMADRIIVIFNGQVQQIGTPRELYERPVSVTVAKFGGEQTMNILPARALAENGQTWLALTGQRIPAPAHVRRALEAGGASQDILLGVRPPDVECNLTESNGALTGEIYAVEHSGRMPVVTAKVGEQLIEVISECLVDAPVGTPIWLSFEKSRVYVFDAASSQLVTTSTGKATF